MVFSSIEFLFRFLPIFLICYFLTPNKYRNVTLLSGSLLFYAYGEPVYVLLMLFSIYINFILARTMAIANDERQGKGKPFMVIAITYDISMLFVFKYFGFFANTINSLLGKEFLPELSLTLPLGISFYTFQIISYVADVYCKRVEMRGSILNFATYVSMFPQLIAGPIVNFKEVEENLKERKVNYRYIEWGTCLFIMGLSYKVLLANKIGSLWNDIQTVGVLGINTPMAWLGSWGYSMQIYFDFFGYSLMAVGLGRILGFHLPSNFDNPYCVKSATSFWRKWHITLGRWFREYVYIPLGGNRKGKPRMIFNLFVVWVLTGLWHGANWNFIIWGVFFFVILMAEKVLLLKPLEKSRILGHIYMLVLIPVSWTIFNITNLNELIKYLSRMFGIGMEGSMPVDSGKFFELAGTYGWLLVICIICCTPYPLRLLKILHRNIICKLLLLALFWICVYELLKGGSNPFLYFRF